MLAAGTTLGSYKILAPLGAGGMGEVHRTRDTGLGRDVALKVIHAEVTCDRGRGGVRTPRGRTVTRGHSAARG